ncbi:uncharacterized protein LACBIDRAFT_325587 [Laccaria bicolor S238N-H82]|uniref:Predicted protein n=1 Tax=Laccaria bicolor (strain S238N-H82 / ATCC MYA-4686) TaxID=486041 RepID=B0D5J7_LACBS|nr:uncharacterized protein LACBIDRAFT_325587 [Laccaria bicolor S238N-H82]EDR10033.1 predicted protein [Laccaria bicolor S238N-H82]|eukprot:XP_001879418.1 predicted protein [Laccaria bicolor S238N-H82]
MTYFPCGLPSKWKVARKGMLHVPKTLRETVYETVNSSWRPSCVSISLNVDSFGYYFMSLKRSDKPFTKPSTLRGGMSTFLCLDFLQRRLVWILPYVPKTLRQTVYESVNSSWRLIWTLLHILKTLQQTVYESIDPLWRNLFP